MIPRPFIQDLLERVDIVDVIGRYVSLKKGGVNYLACCPFHVEKTPSFSVSPLKQFYHCFGCGAHGSAISFLMEYSALGFVESVQELARLVGMQIPHEVDGQSRSDSSYPETPFLFEAMSAAARYYQQQLKSAPNAIAYLKGRGVSGEIAGHFGIGYAPEGWQNLVAAVPDYSSDQLTECGLVILNESGRRYDRFRDRIMFPIVNMRGNIVGFGGRVLGDGEPKYLNSPETPLFEKGRELYGLFQARAAIRAAGFVIVVEGYMDVVALAQYGVTNCVAALGTATTDEHVQKLLRQTDHVIFCFDGDTAGRKAALRAMQSSLEPLTDNKSVSFLFLPAKDDPDSFIRQNGIEVFREFIKSALPLSEYLLQELKSNVNLASAEGRAQLAHQAKPLLARIQAPLLRLQLVKEIAAASRFAQHELEALCGLSPTSGAFGVSRRRLPPQRIARPAARSLEYALLRMVLQKPEWAERLPLDIFVGSSEEAAALRAVAKVLDEDGLAKGGLGLLLEKFRDTPHAKILSGLAIELIDENCDEDAMEAVFSHTLERVRCANVAREIAREVSVLNEKALKVSLTPDEGYCLAKLLAQKQAIKPIA